MATRPHFSFLLAACLAAFACTPGESPPAHGAPMGADPHAPAPAGVATPPAPPAPPGAMQGESAPVRAMIHNVSLSLSVDDPGSSLERAEELLRKLGGEVTYASANGDNANLNGRVPIEARHRLRDALAQLGGSLQSENLSTSDVSQEVRRLQRRLATLQRADAQVAMSFGAQRDPAQVEAAALLRELTERERQSIESQLESYRTQTEDAQVNVSFMRRGP